MMIDTWEKQYLPLGDNLTYLTAVIAAVDDLPEEAITDVCPECGEQQTTGENHAVIVREEDGLAVLVLAIGCEGYWVIDPALVGLNAPDWQP